MKEIEGDFWEFPFEAKIIPTNGIVRGDGTAVMGKGLALQLAQRWPFFPSWLGERLEMTGNGVYAFKVPKNLVPELLCMWVITVPTKDHWKDGSNPNKIRYNLQYMQDAVRMLGIHVALLPRLGCGAGQLDWEADVAPILRKLDDMYTVIHKGDQSVNVQDVPPNSAYEKGSC